MSIVVFRWIMGLVVFVCLLPFVSVLVSGAVASLGHCQVDEGNVHPCVIGGVDYGQALYTMFVMGWFGLATLPILGPAAALWAIVEVVGWTRVRSAARRAGRD